MIENELRQLISKAKACLTDLCPYTTHVAQLALEDMIQQELKMKMTKMTKVEYYRSQRNASLAIGIGTKRMLASLQRSVIRWHPSGLSRERFTVHMD